LRTTGRAVPTLNRQEFLALYDQGPEACWKAYASLLEQVAARDAEAQELRGRLKQDSSNSHRPPASDLGKRQRNNSRTRSGRKPGGQPGHPGHTLQQVTKPDRTVLLRPERCPCGHEFGVQVAPDRVEKRQVFDIPQPKLEVTEYQAATLTCPRCGTRQTGGFPTGVAAPVQYGPQIKAIAVNLNVYNFVPCARTVELLRDLFGVPMSVGSLSTITAEAAGHARPTVQKITDAIRAAAVAHFDETGFRSQGRRRWLHVAATPQWTVYFHHEQRGAIAMRALGILPVFTGVAVHDHWSPYYTFTECLHEQCGAHLLRDNQGVSDTFGLQWPVAMKQLLKEAKTTVDQAKTAGQTHLTKTQLAAINRRYQTIIREGRDQTPPPPPPTPGKRGRPKRGKALALLDRLAQHTDQILGFTANFRVPFDNNLAERDIRMAKLKQKNSGGFRSKHGAEDFCLIRSVISTTVKQTGKVMDAIGALINGVAPNIST
jgi:hypothetical protein